MSKFFFKYENKKNWKAIWVAFKDYISELGKHKKDFYIEIKTHKVSPTTRQRAYYYGVVLPIIKKAMEKDGNIIKSKKGKDDIIRKLDRTLREIVGFQEIDYNLITNKPSIRIKSLSDMSGDKNETIDYLIKLIIWAEEFWEIKIPRPELRGYDFLLTNEK